MNLALYALITRSRSEDEDSVVTIHDDGGCLIEGDLYVTEDSYGPVWDPSATNRTLESRGFQVVGQWRGTANPDVFRARLRVSLIGDASLREFVVQEWSESKPGWTDSRSFLGMESATRYAHEIVGQAGQVRIIERAETVRAMIEQVRYLPGEVAS